LEQDIHDTNVKKVKWRRAIDYRFGKIEHVLYKLTTDCTAENIHDFRVEIKKLKALIRLFSFSIRETSACKFPKSLNKVYKSLGSLREWQIQKQRITKAAGEMHYVGTLDYKHKIDRKTDVCRRRVIELIRRLRDWKKNRDQIKNNCPEKSGPESISAFIQMKMHAIQDSLLSGDYNDESMHDMRKKLKDVQYILSAAKKEEEIKKHTARLKSVQSVSGNLGNFHDLCIALLMLKKEIKMLHKKTSEKKLLWKIRDNWYTEKVKLRQQTIQSMQALILHHFSEVGTN
jgi:CHAD domain-containing protein